MKTKWYKWGLIVAIAAFLFLYGRKCGRDSLRASIDTAMVRVDTIWQTGLVIDTFYVPKLYKVEVHGKPMVRTMVDTVEVPVIVEVEEGHETAYYRDSVKIDHGFLTISDTLTGNRIAGRSVKADIDIPIITNTVTLYQPKRNIVYLGFNVSGGPKNYLYSLGSDLSLKTKNDRIYSAGVSLTRDNQVLYEAGVKFPIHLRIFDRR